MTTTLAPPMLTLATDTNPDATRWITHIRAGQILLCDEESSSGRYFVQNVWRSNGTATLQPLNEHGYGIGEPTGRYIDKLQSPNWWLLPNARLAPATQEPRVALSLLPLLFLLRAPIFALFLLIVGAKVAHTYWQEIRKSMAYLWHHEKRTLVLMVLLNLACYGLMWWVYQTGWWK